MLCTFGPTLAILAWTGHKLSRADTLAIDTQTPQIDTYTNPETQATPLPENGPRVKMELAAESPDCDPQDTLGTN